MKEYKNPFASKTVWGVIIGAIGLIGPLLGLEVDKEEAKGVVEQAGSIWPEVAQAFGLVLTLIGRINANKPIRLKAPKKTDAPLPLVLLLLIPMWNSAPGTGNAGEAPVGEGKSPLFGTVNTEPHWVVAAYTSGLFVTDNSEAINGDAEGIGGGLYLSRVFNDAFEIRGSAYWLPLDNTPVFAGFLDIVVNEPLGGFPFSLFPFDESAFTFFPDLPDIQGYAFVGSGLQLFDSNPSFAARAGIGFKIPLGEKVSYFIEGDYTYDSSGALRPYSSARTGLSVSF